jgi:hypothetical protein
MESQKLSVADFAAKIKAKYPEYSAIEDSELTRRIVEKYPDYADSVDLNPTQNKTWADKLSLGGKSPLNDTARATVDLVEGAASGLANTVYQGGDLIRRMTGQERIINKPEVKQAITAPDSLAGKAGKFAEQGAEFAVPMGIVAKAGKAAKLGWAAKAALEGATSGAVTAAQTGGDPTSTAIGITLGAAGPLVSEYAPQIAKAWGISEEAAAKQYARVLNATTKGNKWLSKNEVSQGLIDRKVAAVTMKGLQTKIGKNLVGTGTAIGDAWDALPAGSSVSFDEIAAAMDKSASDAFTISTSRGSIAKGPLAKAGLNHIDDLKTTLKNVAEIDPQTGKEMIPVDRVRDLRQYFDGIAAKAGRYQGRELADESLAEAHGMAADAIREELAKQYPSIDVLNKEYHFWKDAAKVVGDTIERREGQAKPLGRKMMGAAGAAAGFGTAGVHGLVLGKVAGESLEALITSPAWNTVSAIWKDNLAKSIASGAKLQSEFWINKMIQATGIKGITAISVQKPQTLQPSLAAVQ